MLLQSDDLLFLLDFCIWADNHILESCHRLSEEQFHSQQHMGYGTAFETLVHIMAAQETWLSRWTGQAPDHSTPREAFKNLDTLKAHWADVHTRLRAYLTRLDEQMLHASLNYTTSDGTPYTDSLLWLILHVFNHSTEHRVQIAAICAEAGLDVGPLDIVHYTRHIRRKTG